MKTHFKLLLIALLLSIIACGPSADEIAKKDAETRDKQIQDSIKDKQIKDSIAIAVEQERIDSIANAKIGPEDIKVRIYFTNYSYEWDENGLPNQVEGSEKIVEREEFQKEKYIGFSYDAETFNKLTIEANASGITLIVKDPDYTIFKKENFEIKNKITFNAKDLNWAGGPSQPITVIVKQGDLVLFKGTIESFGTF